MGGYMPVAAELSPAFRETSERKGITVLWVSKATVDTSTTSAIPIDSLPTVTLEYLSKARDDGLDKIPVNKPQQDLMLGEVRKSGHVLHESGGGNGFNGAVDMKRVAPDARIRLRAWTGNDAAGTLVENDLKRHGIEADLVPIPSGETPTSLVLQVQTDNGTEKLSLNRTPDDMPSSFDDAITDDVDFIVLNSTAGKNWHTDLEKGVNKLKLQKKPYAVIAGTAQITEVKENPTGEKANAVYEAMNGAYAVCLNVDELEVVLNGKKGVPWKIAKENREEHISGLLKEAKNVLGAERIIATYGKKGAYAIDIDGSMHWVGLPNANAKKEKAVEPKEEIRSANGAGDAFTAILLQRLLETDGDMRLSLPWASASASFAVQSTGAHDNPPDRKALIQRVVDGKPAVLHVAGSLKDIPREERLNTLTKSQEHIVFIAA